MRMLEDLFRKPKQEVSIVCAALHSWSLLLSIAPQHLIPALFTRYYLCFMGRETMLF